MTAFNITMAAFVSQPSASTLSSSHYHSPASLASYLRYPPSSVLLLSLSDPSLSVPQQCNDTSVVVQSTHGNQRVTPLQYIQRARVLQPDALLLVSDSHTAANESERGRERKAALRTVRWVREQMQLLYGGSENNGQTIEADGNSSDSGERKSKRQRKLEKQEESVRVKQQRAAAESVDANKENESSVHTAAATTSALSADGCVKPPYIVVPVPLTTDSALQQHCVQAITAYSHLADGISVTIPPINTKATLSLLPSVLSQLPSSSLRICSSHPHSLSSLFAIACSSIDLISTALPYHHSLLGLALSLHEPALSLHSTTLATSALPLAADCRCYTCTHHTRAYVHHLLRVKEMTGTVLLDIHNTHTVFEMMRMVRERLASQQTVEDWQEWVSHWTQKFEANEKADMEERAREQTKSTDNATLQSGDKFAVSSDVVSPPTAVS